MKWWVIVLEVYGGPSCVQFYIEAENIIQTGKKSLEIDGKRFFYDEEIIDVAPENPDDFLLRMIKKSIYKEYKEYSVR